MVCSKISIIVPVYNARTTLRRCIDSVLSQNYSDLELILVDDGSDDGSDELCLEAANKDNRIKVLIKKNEGVSATRNRGLDAATGDYVVFLDSDDILFPGALVALMSGCDADLVVGGFSHVNLPARIKSEHLSEHKKINVCKDAEYLVNKIGVFFSTPWCKLFKSSVINSNDLRFCNDLFYGEDTDFVLRYLLCIEHVQFVSKVVYCYNDAVSAKYGLKAIDFKKLSDCISTDFNLLSVRTNYSFSGPRDIFLSDYSSLYLNDLQKKSILHGFFR